MVESATTYIAAWTRRGVNSQTEALYLLTVYPYPSVYVVYPLIRTSTLTLHSILMLTFRYKAENDFSFIIVQEMFIEILILTSSFKRHYTTRRVLRTELLHG